MSLRGRRSSAGPGKKPRDEERSVGLGTVAREWLRIGCIRFGRPPPPNPPPSQPRGGQCGWLSAEEFEEGVAAPNLLPGPASTQLAMFCAWRLAGPAGAVVGGACFILPGLGVILALAALFLAAHPPSWVAGAAAGAGAAVPAVAVAAAVSLMPASWGRAGSGARAGPGARAESGGWARWRWGSYLVAGGLAGGLARAFLMPVL